MPKKAKNYPELPLAALRGSQPSRTIGRAVPAKRRAGVHFGGQTAVEALREGGFGRGREVISLSIGQWDLSDWIEACLLEVEKAGKVDALICAWTVSPEAIDRINSWQEAGRLSRCRWIIETTNFWNPRYRVLYQRLRDCFGAECIAPLRVHSKFGLLSAGDWRVVAMSSANLNRNPRIELFHAADDPALWGVLDQFAADAFKAADGVKLHQHVNLRLKQQGVENRALELGLPRAADMRLA